MKRLLYCLMFLLVLSTSCMNKPSYEDLLDELDEKEAQITALEEQVSDLEYAIEELQSELEECQAEVEELEYELNW